MNIQYQRPTATLEDWYAAEYTDIFNQQKVNFDEREKLAKTVAFAMGRREDQLILNALATGGQTATVGTVGTALVSDDLASARATLLHNGVDEMANVCAILPGRWYKDLAADVKVVSTDYVNGRMVQTGMVPHLHGMKVKFIEDRSTAEGFNPSDGIGWVIEQDAVGLAVGLDHRTEINYIPEKTSWLTNGILSAGAVTIDNRGVIKLQGANA